MVGAAAVGVVDAGDAVGQVLRAVGLQVEEGIGAGEAVAAQQRGAGVGIQQGDFEGVVGCTGEVIQCGAARVKLRKRSVGLSRKTWLRRVWLPETSFRVASTSPFALSLSKGRCPRCLCVDQPSAAGEAAIGEGGIGCPVVLGNQRAGIRRDAQAAITAAAQQTEEADEAGAQRQGGECRCIPLPLAGGGLGRG